MRFHHVLSVSLLVPMLVFQLGCEPSPPVDSIAPASDTGLSLLSGNLTLTVDPAAGGRVSSLRFGAQELLAQSSPLDATNWGSTLWISPQESWGWPPPESFDDLPYSTESQVQGLTLVGPVDEQKTGLQIIKQAHSMGGDRFRMHYQLVNPGAVEKWSAAWEVTRVPIAGLVIFATETAPAWWSFGGFPIENFGGLTWIDLRASQLSEGKLNANGRGWLAWVRGRTLFVKRFADLEAASQAPKEAELQVYISPRGYMELEAQSAYQAIGPGESLDFETEWQVLTLPDSIEVDVDSPSLQTYLQSLGLAF